MTSEQILAFVGFALVMAATPGPSNTLLTATAMQVGIARGLPALLGVALGMAVLIFTVSVGLGALILATPVILLALRVVGAAVLAWLAFQIVTAPSKSPSSPTAATATPAKIATARPVGFVAAATFQWVNPKSWLAAASAAAFLTASPMGTFAQAALLAAIFVAVALPSCFAWLAFGAALHALLRSSRAQRIFNIAMAALLAASAAALLAGVA